LPSQRSSKVHASPSSHGVPAGWSVQSATVRLLVPALLARGLRPAPLPEILGLTGVWRAVAPPSAAP